MDYDEREPLIPSYIPAHYGTPLDSGSSGSGIMENPPIGISQQQLVNGGDGSHPGKKFPQYVAGLSATLGALAVGALLGWAAPAGPKITTGNEYGFTITDSDNAWVGSLATLGAACACFPSGLVMDKLGRKKTSLIMVPVFVLGWCLIIWATNLPMLYVGRFIIGIVGGTYCITLPAYNSEIAQDKVRGTLGSFFQLMITAGFLFVYIIGSYVTVKVMSIVCGILPIIFAVIFYFMPETPYFLVSKGRIDEASKALVKLRGKEYDTDSELRQIQIKVEDSHANPESFKVAFSKVSAKKAFSICMALMFFQQFSGINAVLFNTSEIFQNAGASIEPSIATIIVGAMQVVATFLSAVVIDKLGRRILLLFSAIVMVICVVALGIYFYLQNLPDKDADLIESISWLPLASLCIFIVSFSLGFGPIPWMVAGEVCTPNIKAVISSAAGTFNWVLAFIITKTFVDMKKGMGEGGTFWFFAGVTFVGAVFVYFFVPETKGKSLDDIQRILEGEEVVSSEKKSSIK